LVNTPDWQSIATAVADNGIRINLSELPRPVGGGDISAAWRVMSNKGPLFFKTGGTDCMDMLQAEADGLQELARAEVVRVPSVLACGCTATSSYLALEWLSLGAADAAAERRFGRQLANLHKTTREKFGWYRDNTIGRTPQHNSETDSWLEFFREQRLVFQLNLAASNGFTGALQAAGAQLAGNLESILGDHQPAASLLHGDLWGGNFAMSDGSPVMYDPAVYFGDRETDLAMTRLFGGFSREFYAAYNETWPLPEGHERRETLYQLYHVLNHLNLFGRSYLGRAMSQIELLLF
jgi:fructosamine-3-kinase